MAPGGVTTGGVIIWCRRSGLAWASCSSTREAEVSLNVPGLSRGERLTAYSEVSTALALCSDRALGELVDAAEPAGSGIGGKSARLEIAGTQVFVKQIPLTDLDREPGNARSTANLFGLPVFCQYGLGGKDAIGSPGFGAWRELAVHLMTTNWVLAGEYEGFPLTYHWRVLPDSAPLPEELADVERAVAAWGGAPQVRRRIEALRQSSASVALFLEHIPDNLHHWLGTQTEAGDQATDRACAMVERELAAGVGFMNSRGLLHFDAHFENILTDGQRLYFADYGLAISSRFELSPDETGFFARHQTYDRLYTASYLVTWLVTALYGLEVGDGDSRAKLVHAYAGGQRPTGIPPGAAAVIARHAPAAAVMSDFNRALRVRGKQAPYPVEEVRRALS